MKYVLKYILLFISIPFFLFSACNGTLPDQPKDAQTSPAPVCVTPQQDWAEAVLYFVLIDRFVDGDPANNVDVDISRKGYFHGGDLKGLTDQLDELADLGVTAVWINPVVKNIDHYVEGAGFPDWAYHGYWADDFYQVDSRFGSEQEMQAFVRACHDRGIKVLLDVVYNHVGYESHYLKKPDANDWLRTGRRESRCGEDDITQCVAGLPDVKTEDPETADFVLTAHMDWARRFGVDGFRLDTVKHIDHDFWQAHRARADRELGEDFFLLGEIWGGIDRSSSPTSKATRSTPASISLSRGVCRASSSAAAGPSPSAGTWPRDTRSFRAIICATTSRPTTWPGPCSGSRETESSTSSAPRSSSPASAFP